MEAENAVLSLEDVEAHRKELQLVELEQGWSRADFTVRLAKMEKRFLKTFQTKEQ